MSAFEELKQRTSTISATTTPKDSFELLKEKQASLGQTTAQEPEITVTKVEPKKKEGFSLASKLLGPVAMIPEYVKNLFGTYKSTVEKIPEDIKAGASDIEKGKDEMIKKGIIKSTLRPAGDIAEAIYAPISVGVGMIMEKSGIQKKMEDVSKYLVDKSGIADNKWFQDFAVSHPNAEEDINRALVLAMAKGEREGINPKDIIKDTKSLLQDAENATIDLKKSYDEYKTNRAIYEADNLIRQATDVSAKGVRSKTLKKTGDEISTLIREEQIPLGTQTGTKSVMIDATIAKPVIQERLNALDSTLDEALATNKTRQFSARDLQKMAEEKIDKYTKDSTDAVIFKNKLKERIDNFINDPRYGEKIYDSSGNIIDTKLNGQELREASSGWGKAKGVNWNSPSDYNALNQLYLSANDAINSAYPNLMIPEIRKQFSRLLTLDEALNPQKVGSLHGKIISSGGLGQNIFKATAKITGAATGGALGSFFGPIGTSGGIIGGQAIGGRISEYFTKRGLSPEMKTTKAINILRKAKIKTKTDVIVEKAREYNRRQQRRILYETLTTPSSLLLAPPEPIIYLGSGESLTTPLERLLNAPEGGIMKGPGESSVKGIKAKYPGTTKK